MNDFENRVQETLRLLQESCQQREISIAGDGSVSEAAAENLLGYARRTMRHQRDEGRLALPRRRVGNRWMYRLKDLAAYLESSYEPGWSESLERSKEQPRP